MQYWKRNCLRNLPTQYGIYYLNHGKVVYIANHVTLNLGHWKSAVDIPRAAGKGYIYYKLPVTSVSGSVFVIYTSLPWFPYNIYQPIQPNKTGVRGEALLLVNTFKCWEVLCGVLCHIWMLRHSKEIVISNKIPDPQFWIGQKGSVIWTEQG